MCQELIEEFEVKSKFCSKCKENKSWSEFNKQKRGKYGLYVWCKICAREYNKQNADKRKERSKEYNKQNADRKRKYDKEYNKQNAAKKKEQRKEYYKQNADKIKEQRKEYYKQNTDKIKEQNKEYYKQNINKIKEHNKAYCKLNADRKRKYYKEYNKQNADKIKERGEKYYKQNTDKIIEKKKEYCKQNALYKTFSNRLSIYNDIKESPEGFILVQCKYCNQWITPTILQVQNRLKTCEITGIGELHFYCNDNDGACKHACPSYKRQLYPKGFRAVTSREVLPELRKMVFERDNWQCIKCENTNKNSELHCHHIKGATQNAMESNDIDNCITVCKSCHKEIHKQKGCSYVDYKRDKC